MTQKITSATGESCDRKKLYPEFLISCQCGDSISVCTLGLCGKRGRVWGLWKWKFVGENLHPLNWHSFRPGVVKKNWKQGACESEKFMQIYYSDPQTRNFSFYIISFVCCRMFALARLAANEDEKIWPLGAIPQLFTPNFFFFS